MNDDRLGRAIAAIDAANASDPNLIVVRGATRPKELAHAALVSEWVRRLDADPSDALLLAARAHHLRRWTIPRASYPEGRAAYLRWRRALQDQTANDVAGILDSVGYDAATVARVQELVRKRGLGASRGDTTEAADREVQVLEDALCLVFVETQLHDIAARMATDKLVGVIAKTMAKMSVRAIELAAGLEIDPADHALLEQALSQRDVVG